MGRRLTRGLFCGWSRSLVGISLVILDFQLADSGAVAKAAQTWDVVLHQHIRRFRQFMQYLDAFWMLKRQSNGFLVSIDLIQASENSISSSHRPPS